MDEELKRLERYGLLEISKINSTGVKCRLSLNCIKGIINSIRGVYTDYQSLNEKRKKEIVLNSIKDMIQQIAFCNGDCSNCNFSACKVIFEIWEQMVKAGQVKLQTGMIVEHHTSLTLSVVEKEVKEVFKKDGFVSPAIFTPDKLYEIPPFKNRAEKKETYKALRELIQKENPKKYWFVSEVWCRHNVSTSPSKDKNKEEKAMIIEFNRDDPTKERVVLYDLDSDNHVLVNREEHTKDGSNSRLNFYLEDTFDEKNFPHTMIDKSIKIITAAEAKGKIKENRRFIQQTLTIYYNEHDDTCFEIIYGDEIIYSANIEGKTTSIDQKAFEEYRRKYKFTKKETGETKAEIFKCDGETFAVINPPPDDEICQRCGRKSEELGKTFRNLDGVTRASWECPNCIEEDTIS